MKEKHSKLLFIVFPAITMMLAWGLRGYIGGGPFGAMIPGAMVAISIGLLLELPASVISAVAVFGVVGIGLGGEMTYGQTLSFLRNPETVWWGTLGTTVKGAIWGMVGGAVMALGFFFRQIPKRTIVIAFLLFMVGMFAGFKLINDPMIIYFSDPANPRPETWAALLVGAIIFLVFLKLKINKDTFEVICKFSFWGMIGGALGFGLGGFWFVIGRHLPDVVFKEWWKAMEFTFGLLFGAALGYVSWTCRKELKALAADYKIDEPTVLPKWKELAIIFVVGFLTYWLIPNLFEPFVDASKNSQEIFTSILYELGRIVANYIFYGFLFILVILRYPKMAWQIAITFTFCHTVVDLFIYPNAENLSVITMYFFWFSITTTIVAILVTLMSRKKNETHHLFHLLVWSCIIVAFWRIAADPEVLNIENLSVCEIICHRFVVHLIFLVSAIAVSFILNKKIIKLE